MIIIIVSFLYSKVGTKSTLYEFSFLVCISPMILIKVKDNTYLCE